MPRDTTPKGVQPGMVVMPRRDTKVADGEEGVWGKADRKTPERWVEVRTDYGDVG